MAQALLPNWLVGPITYRDLCLELGDATTTVYWCQRHKLLSDSKNCARCGAGMNLVKQKDVSCGLGWRCTRKRCRKELALRSGTFFEGQQEMIMIMIMIDYLLTLYTGSNIAMEQVIRVLHLWSTKTPLGKMMVEVEVSLQYGLTCT